MINLDKNQTEKKNLEISKKQRDHILKSFGRRVKELRLKKDRKFSQEKLGEACGLHRNYISDCERGQRNICLESIFYIVLKGLDCSISDFFAEGFDHIELSNSNFELIDKKEKTDE